MLNHLFYHYSVKHTLEHPWGHHLSLTTCNPDAKQEVTSSETPQEVEDREDVVFTYDVHFQVRPPFFPSWNKATHNRGLYLQNVLSGQFQSLCFFPSWFSKHTCLTHRSSCRRVTSSGLLDGRLTVQWPMTWYTGSPSPPPAVYPSCPIAVFCPLGCCSRDQVMSSAAATIWL